MGEKMFYRICDSVKDYGEYVPVTDNIFEHVNQEKPYYQSIYMYSQEQVNEATKLVEVEKNGKKYKRPKGIAGITDVKTKKLVFDFDSKDIEDSRQDALEIVNRLVNKGFKEDDLGIFFSGGKGFHVEVEIDTLLTPSQAKSIATKLATGLKTFDSVVYNASRVFRVPYTKHNSSGYYKTRITLDELEKTPLQEVLEIAKEAYEPQGLREVHLPEGLLALASTKEEDVKNPEVELDFDKFNASRNPHNLSNWKNALFQGFFPPGQRSNALLILAATFSGMGFDADETYAALKATIRKQSTRYDQDIFSKEEFYNNIVAQVFGGTWQGGTYAEDNFPEAIKEHLTDLGIPRMSLSSLDKDLVVGVEEGMSRFFDYATKIEENRMEFGISSLDRLLKPQVGHFVGLLGPPGSGKTSLALELLSSMSKKGIKCYFGSYDMNSNILFQKLLQRETGLTDDEIYDIYKKKDTEKIKKLTDILKKHYTNVTFDFKSGCGIPDLKKSIARKENEIGEEIKLVVVDYIELITSEKSDATAASAEAAQGLREIANSGKLVIVLLQPNKMSTKLDEAPKSYTGAKGSSAIAQAVTSMMGVFRPGYSPEDPSMDKFYGIAILKNRMGPLGTCYFDWNGPRGKITELEDIQRQELQEYLDWKKQVKGEENSGLL